MSGGPLGCALSQAGLPDAACQPLAVTFTGTQARTGPLCWGQRAIWQDMAESGNQFTMGGRMGLPDGATAQDAAGLLSGLMSRHEALRTRLIPGPAGRPHQESAACGEASLAIVTIPEACGEDDVHRHAASLMDTWPPARFDFYRDWPLRMALLTHRGHCRYLVWSLSHLVADGGAHLLLLDDLVAAARGNPPAGAPDVQLLDVAASEQVPSARQLSSRSMRHWEAQLRNIPPQTFSGCPRPLPAGEQRYWQARFTSPAAHLAMAAIARRTGTDASRVALAMIAIAIARVTGASPLTLKVMVNNRFRAGLAGVIAPIAQNSVLTIDVAGTCIDEAVTRARSAAVPAGMRAYYDPDDLTAVMGRLDAGRGHPARVTCRVNDQRAMVRRDDAAASDADAGDAGPAAIARKLADTTLSWLGPRYNMHEQVNILIENKPGVVSLHMMWDRQCLSEAQAEALLRGVEEAAVEAAFNPAAPTGVAAATAG